MKSEQTIINQQIIKIKEAMAEAQLWSEEAPEWVYRYQSEVETDIWQWLQFIYFPARSQHQTKFKSFYLAPCVSSFIDPSIETHVQLVRGIIELDAMTSAPEKLVINNLKNK